MTKEIKKYVPGVSVSVCVAIFSKWLDASLPNMHIGGATLAILIGIVLGNTCIKHKRYQVGTKFSESKLLEYAVVLLGFTVTFKTIAQLGLTGFFYILSLMSCVLLGTYWLGKKLGFPVTMRLLMAGGNAVCGSSAIGAMAPEIKATEEEKGQIITLVNLLGTMLMLTLPFLAMFLYPQATMTQTALVGGTLQSVGQVVAGANFLGEDAVAFAMLYKMARIVMLVYVIYICQIVVQRNGHSVLEKRQKKLPMPWYILAFLIICTINSTIGFSPIFLVIAKWISGWFETIALAAIGLRLDIKRFIEEGPRFLLYGIGVGALQVAVAIALIYLLHI